MLKQITNTDKKYVSVPVTDLKLDAAPKVNSFNGITSDAVARAIAGASGEVPQVLEGDNGKVLTAVYDEGGPAVEWAEAQGGGGDILTVVYDSNDLPEGQEIDDLADEISAAVAAGKSVQLLDVNENIVANLTAIDNDFSWSGPTFMSPMDRDDNMVNYFKEYHLGTDQSNRGWSVNTNYAGPQIPAPTSDDANKVAVATPKSTAWGSNYMAYEPKDAAEVVGVDGTSIDCKEAEDRALVRGSGTPTVTTNWKEFNALQINGSGSMSLAGFEGTDLVTLKVSSAATASSYGVQVADRESISTYGNSKVCLWVGVWNDQEWMTEYSFVGELTDDNGDPILWDLVEAGMTTNYFKISGDGHYEGTVNSILGPDWASSVQYNDYATICLGTDNRALTSGYGTKWLTTGPSDDALALHAYLSKANGHQLYVKVPVPSFDTTTDLGKVLTVTASGLAWVTPT